MLGEATPASSFDFPDALQTPPPVPAPSLGKNAESTGFSFSLGCKHMRDLDRRKGERSWHQKSILASVFHRSFPVEAERVRGPKKFVGVFGGIV
jgi:hypothetical protein